MIQSKKIQSEVFRAIRNPARHLLVAIPIALITGSLVALFLWSLDKATAIRLSHKWLLFLLPLAGVGIHFLYRLWGKESEAGNNLIIDNIHEPGKGVPPRMGPLILLSTVITHFFGGSAGREGTAVQIGGSVAQFVANRLKLSGQDLSMMLLCGIAAGFGAVFGTPFAGALFAIEVLAIGAMPYRNIFIPLCTAILADLVCAAWGIRHIHYTIGRLTDTIPAILLCTASVAAGALFGFCSRLFSLTAHRVRSFAHAFIPGPAWLIPLCGGLAILLLCYLTGTDDYLGLGVYPSHTGGVSIITAFHEGGAAPLSWAWKILFTAITLGTGFKGGEVTPLFFIGATLGNILAIYSGYPVDLFAALGFIAVFAGATNTPVACTIMGIELFGPEYALYFALACFAAYYTSGHKGIYTAQRVVKHKYRSSSM